MRRATLRLLAILLAAHAMHAHELTSLGVYHETTCPYVDRQRAIRVKRGAAEARGLIAAADCHPEGGVRYLGISGASPRPREDAGRAKTVHVRAYIRDVTYVSGYVRAARGN